MIVETKRNGKIITYDDDYNVLYIFESVTLFGRELIRLQNISNPLTNDEVIELDAIKNRINELNQKDLDYAAFVNQGLEKKLNEYLTIDYLIKNPVGTLPIIDGEK